MASGCLIRPLRALLTGGSRNPYGHAGRLVEKSPGRTVEDCYVVGRTLGQGGFGTVNLAKERHSGLNCALKVLHLDGREALAEQEAKVHAELDHPHIVRLHEVLVEEDRLCMVLELCGGGELSEVLDTTQSACTEVEAQHLFGQIMQAVCYMQSKSVVHRDIKLGNLLIKESNKPMSECTVKLIDFGFASHFTPGKPSLKTKCGTVGFAAPEVIRCPRYDEKCDIFSCGIVLYCLLCAEMPCDDSAKHEILHMPTYRSIRLFDTIQQNLLSWEAQHLVHLMCCTVPDFRLSACQVLGCAWLQGRSSEVFSC